MEEGSVGEATKAFRALPTKPKFKPLSAHEVGGGKFQYKKVFVPAHPYTPMKNRWMDLYTPITEQMNVNIRMNLKSKKVELKTQRKTPGACALQKCADFVHAYVLGFDIHDAIALLRLDDLYVESFEIKDVKTLHDFAENEDDQHEGKETSSLKLRNWGGKTLDLKSHTLWN